jgi:glycosyltransferase involved in cell wall biosynthesis
MRQEMSGGSQADDIGRTNGTLGQRAPAGGHPPRMAWEGPGRSRQVCVSFLARAAHLRDCDSDLIGRAEWIPEQRTKAVQAGTDVESGRHGTTAPQMMDGAELGAAQEPTGSKPHVSVVICTRNREDKIGTAVSSVLACEYPSFDLTIIDQSTTDATGVAVREVAQSDGRVDYVHTDEPGLSRAYNNGIRRSRGEILAFTDDDCIAPPDWITNVVSAFLADSEGDLLYGDVVAAGEAIEDNALTPALRIQVPRRLSKKDGFEVFGMGANFAARRRLFERVGMFDEMLGGGGPLWSSQDFDLTYRAYHAGCVILLRPEVVMKHDGRRELDDWPSLLLAYGSGDGAFYTKHVRCLDPYATWLLARKVVGSSARVLYKLIVERSSVSWPYFKGLLRGMRGSFRFGVDRSRRIYVER